MARMNYNNMLGIDSNITNSLVGNRNSPSSLANKNISNLETNKADKDLNTSNSNPLSKLGFQPSPNILNNYSNPTYHFELSMMSDVFEEFKKSKKIVIAESGKSELNILRVTGSSNIGPNYKTKNTQWSKFEITLFEPMGSSFYDKLALAAKQLDVKNIHKSFYNLKLYFLGYDPKTNQPVIIDSKSWNWPLSIVDITSQLDPSGCKHILNMIVATCVGLTDEYNMIPQSYQLDGRTLGDVLNSLASNMNSTITNTYTFPMITYKFKYEKYKNTDSSVASPDLHVVNLSDNTSVISRNSDGATVSHGTTIEALIDSLLSNSPTACKDINPGRKVDNSPVEPSNKQPNSFHIKLKTDIKIGTYHELYGDYEKVITYTLVPYDTTRLYGNISSSSEIQDEEYNKKRLKYIIDKKYISKAYDYYFTGNNTEILNFDIQSNFSYYAIQTYQYGFNHDRSIETPQDASNTDIDASIANFENTITSNSNQFEVNQATRNLILAKSQLATKSNNTYNDLTAAKNELANDPSNQSLINRVNELQTQYSTESNKVTDISNYINSSSSVQNYLNVDANSRLTTAQKLNSTNIIPSIDDIKETTAMNNISLPPISLKYKSEKDLGSDHYNVDSAPNNSRSMFMSMLNQLYEPTGSSLASIELVVRGDPYWLGGSFMGDNYNNLDVSETLRSNYFDYEQHPWFIFNETTFLVRFNSPSGFNNDGSIILKSGNNFSGFYNCHTVDHIFENGEFKQILQAYFIPGTNYNKFLGK